jgi:hypothetical protein
VSYLPQWLGFLAVTLSVLAYLPQIARLAKGVVPPVSASMLIFAYSVNQGEPVITTLQIDPFGTKRDGRCWRFADVHERRADVSFRGAKRTS